MPLQNDLRAVIKEVGALYYERGTVARMILTGIVAGQHTLLLGQPGTGKSAIVREITSRIVSAEYWETVLTKFTAPSAIFGPIDVAALAQGTYRQIYDGYATRADIVFFDEIFKCSAAALNSTLAFLNERVYHPELGGPPVRCPLTAAVCASNELGEDDATAALYDRLLIRLEVDYLAKPSSFDRLLRSAVSGPDAAPTRRTAVDLEDLRVAVQTRVPAVGLPNAIVEALRDLRSDLRSRGVISSDRRWKQSVRVLQATAWLEGRDHILVEDLSVLTHVLWDVPTSKAAVADVIQTFLRSAHRRLADITDEITRIEVALDRLLEESDFDRMRTWALQTSSELKLIATRLTRGKEHAHDNARDTAGWERALDQADNVYGRLLVEALGMSEDRVPALGGPR